MLKLSPETIAAFQNAAQGVRNEMLQVQRGERKIEETNLYVSKAKKDENGKLIRNRPAKYKKTKLVVGMQFGDLILRRKLPPKKGVKPSLRERWRVECTAPECGRVVEVPKYYLIRNPNPKTHCGCRVATIKSKNKREFLIWHMIHQRCENPKHMSYKHYKERGITIAPEWHKNCEDGKGFERFFEHVGKSPPGTSLDRIRNTEGYFPGNLRWATAEQQRANQGDRIAGYTAEEIEAMGMTEDEFVQKIIDGEIE